MFVLRVITGGGVEINQSLGDHYNFVDERSKDFPKCMEQTWGEDYEKKAQGGEGISSHQNDTYAFIVSNNGDIIRPLYNTQENYIMTGEGKTFANITYFGNR